MRLVPALTLVTAASAIVIPQALDEFNHLKDEIKHRLEELPSRIAGSVDEAVEHLSSEISNAVHSKLEGHDVYSHEDPVDMLGLDLSDLTIWEILEKSNHTKEFFKLVKDHDKFGKLLDSTDANYTLFAPIDEAFEHIPHDHKPSDEFIESVLNYHLGLGEYPAGRILTTHTLPTALKEPWLGGNPQRLRTSVGFNGVRVNLYSKVVVVNVKAKNGYLHGVNRILIPPPMIGRVISLFPAQFSTLLLAYDKTDFVKYVHNVKMNGSTVFAPPNSAWERLGPKANAFLFNTETGKKYLTALLKYQIVPNTTVYSDEIYYGDEEANKEDQPKANSDFHIELPTLLGKSVGVDIHTWKAWTSIVVNGAIAVDFEDGIGKNGVIQVVRGVPLPPYRKGGRALYVNEHIEVEDLKERLREYVEEEEEDQVEEGEVEL